MVLLIFVYATHILVDKYYTLCFIVLCRLYFMLLCRIYLYFMLHCALSHIRSLNRNKLSLSEFFMNYPEQCTHSIKITVKVSALDQQRNLCVLLCFILPQSNYSNSTSDMNT